MPTAGSTPTQALSWICIVGWKSGVDVANRAAVLAGALGLDGYAAQQRAKRSFPVVVARKPTSEVMPTVEALKLGGAQVLTLHNGELERLPQPRAAKTLQAAIGSTPAMYLVEPWQGESFGISMGDVYAIVRGRIESVSVTKTTEDHYLNQPARGSLFGPSGSVIRGQLESMTSKNVTTEYRCTHVIDLWLLDRSTPHVLPNGKTVFGLARVRINGDRFNWSVLEKSRGLTDAHNADQVALRFAEDAPQAAIEVGFPEFVTSCRGYLMESFTGLPADYFRRNVPPVWEFYSALQGVLIWRKMFG